MPATSTRSDLKVAFFSDSLPERNGTGAYYHDLIKQLLPRLEAAEIFQPKAQGPDPLLSLPMPGDPMQRLVTPNYFRIAKAYKKLQPDIVVAITPGPFGLIGHWLSRKNGAKFITAFHTDFEQLAKIYWNRFSRTIINGYLRNANRYLCKRSEKVLINNSKLKSDVVELGAKRVEIMGTPLAPAFLERPIHPPSNKVEQICFAGRLAAEKNVDLIIQAAANFPDIQFVIGGDGPLRQALEEQTKGQKNIRFQGWLNRNDLIELLDASSCLLLPSKLETFGSVALEAMARGRPALVSANAGIHDWPSLKEGLFTLNNTEELSLALREIIELPTETWANKAKTCRAAAENLNNQTIDQWVQMLQETVQNQTH